MTTRHDERPALNSRPDVPSSSLFGQPPRDRKTGNACWLRPRRPHLLRLHVRHTAMRKPTAPAAGLWARRKWLDAGRGRHVRGQ